jgi:Zn-dependent protease/predicted transcriptional regulator
LVDEEAAVTETFRIGRIAVVQIGVNWSVVVIFALVVLGLAAGRFPLAHPGYPDAAYLAAGVTAGVVFFASLLAHELAHAVVARRNGIEVEGITLWMLGGVAKLEGEPSDPGADFRVAVAGPGTSVVLAVGFGFGAWMLDVVSASPLVVGAAAWLAFINALLAAFNLIPAAPLDGGRILRAVWWWRTGDRQAAAVAAAHAGRVFGWTLIAGGVALALFGGGIGGVWLALIGWFITVAARGEQDVAEATGTLEGVTVGDVMTTDPSLVPSGTSIDVFITDWVFTHRCSTFPVVAADGSLRGLVAWRDVKSLSAQQRGSATVDDVVMPLGAVAVVSPDDPVSETLGPMAATPSGRGVVMADGRVVGVVSPVDIMRRIEVLRLGGRAAQPSAASPLQPR